MPKHILKDQKVCKRLRINCFDAFIIFTQSRALRARATQNSEQSRELHNHPLLR